MTRANVAKSQALMLEEPARIEGQNHDKKMAARLTQLQAESEQR